MPQRRGVRELRRFELARLHPTGVGVLRPPVPSVAVMAMAESGILLARLSDVQEADSITSPAEVGDVLPEMFL